MDESFFSVIYIVVGSDQSQYSARPCVSANCDWQLITSSKMPATGLSAVHVFPAPGFVRPFVGSLRSPPPPNKTSSWGATRCRFNPCQIASINFVVHRLVSICKTCQRHAYSTLTGSAYAVRFFSDTPTEAFALIFKEGKTGFSRLGGISTKYSLRFGWIFTPSAPMKAWLSFAVWLLVKN